MSIFLDVKHSNINVISSFESVTLLEGDTVTLSCTPSIRETVLWWTHNGSVIETNSVAMLTPSTSDQNFIITNAEINDSGIYTCRDAMDNPVLQQNITVIVLPGNKHVNWYIIIIIIIINSCNMVMRALPDMYA